MTKSTSSLQAPFHRRSFIIHSPKELDVFRRLKQGGHEHEHLGEVLVSAGVITQAQLNEALKVQQQAPGARLGRILHDKGWADSEQVLAALAQLLALPNVNLDRFEIENETLSRVPARFAREHRVIPIVERSDQIYVALSDPTDVQLLDLLRFMTGKAIEPALASEEAILTAISKHYDDDDEHNALAELPADSTAKPKTEPGISKATTSTDERPIIQWVQNILSDALTRRASDIHLRPREQHAELLYRIDGQLQSIRQLNKRLLPRLVSRIKVLGNMDLAEHRLPQDGRYQLHHGDGKTVDLRLSVIPSVRGESVVIRLLDTDFALKDLHALGYARDDETRVRHLLAKNQGLFLVTGPTGSGKSTTLYTALTELTQTHRNIITVEDPVEYHQDGITQIQVKSDIGYTFARALRHILRHDPDIVMVGEMRDEETARMAIESALTGHLVLSTLHTNGAASTITRLLEIGIAPYLVSASLLGVLAQRLVRKNCPYCTESENVTPDVRHLLGVDPKEVFYKGQGCERCHYTGVKGRMATYELLTITPELREHIQKDVSAQTLEKQAIADGMTPLTQHALSLARQGAIPLSEVYAVRLD